MVGNVGRYCEDAMKSDAERQDDERIMKLFRGRCIMNLTHPASEINEIIPRSRTNQATTMKNNRVPLCRSCHRIYHWGGLTEVKMQIMYDKAVECLTMFGVRLEDW